MAAATGATVANLYYCQPLLRMMQESFGATVQQTSWIATLTQVGYALGMLFFVSLGDLLERRRLIVIFCALSGIFLLLQASSSSVQMASFLSLMIGLTTMTPQLLIPFAAQLAEPEKRGQVLGTIMSGLLLGILLARTISGFVGAQFGWRVMFTAAGIAMLIASVLLRMVLPKSESSFHGSYLSLLSSIQKIVKKHSALREASFFGAMLFGSFSAFWATLIHLMETPAFNLGSRAVGIFGLLGATGAFVTPFVGKLADQKSPRFVTGLGLFVTAIAFVVYAIWGATSLIALGVGVILMDAGVQSGHVANQSRIFSLDQEARSRINTVYMTSYFTGGALGSYLASSAWDRFGWTGVCSVALLMLALGGLVYVLGRASKKI